jgi:hypothetical protein
MKSLSISQQSLGTGQDRYYNHPSAYNLSSKVSSRATSRLVKFSVVSVVIIRA